jgi:SAM-dependent methyltransferase
MELVAKWPAGYRVLEIGTKQSMPGRSTHSAAKFPAAGQYVKADYQDGADVDVVADIMKLSEVFPPGSFDLVVANSTFEHVAKPWVAADEIHRVLSPGGLCFVQTHQSFPLHAYPFDYWRFTCEAMEVLFYAPKWRTVRTAYEFPCQVVSERDPQGKNHPAFLNVAILTERANA